MNTAEFSPTDRYYLGCDPGQSIDPSAVAIVRVVEGERPVFQVGHLERLPLHTPYPGVVWRVGELLGHPLLRGRTELVLDLTGVGRPVNDLFLDQDIRATCVTITAGFDEAEISHRYFHVPKLHLVSRLQSLLHDGRLRVQPNLPDTPALLDELMSFEASVSDSGRWSFGARSGKHDDLVLALGLAVWRAHSSKLRNWQRLAAQLQPALPPIEGPA